MAKKRTLATLTLAEDRVWTDTFAAYVDEGMTDSKADRETWKEMLEQFPRLRAFDGCRVDVESNSTKGEN